MFIRELLFLKAKTTARVITKNVVITRSRLKGHDNSMVALHRLTMIQATVIQDRVRDRVRRSLNKIINSP